VGWFRFDPAALSSALPLAVKVGRGERIMRDWNAGAIAMSKPQIGTAGTEI